MKVDLEVFDVPKITATSLNFVFNGAIYEDEFEKWIDYSTLPIKMSAEQDPTEIAKF